MAVALVLLYHMHGAHTIGLRELLTWGPPPVDLFAPNMLPLIWKGAGGLGAVQEGMKRGMVHGRWDQWREGERRVGKVTWGEPNLDIGSG